MNMDRMGPPLMVDKDGNELIVRSVEGRTVPGKVVGIRAYNNGQSRLVFEVDEIWSQKTRAEMAERVDML